MDKAMDKKNTSETKVIEILNYGQGCDDEIANIFNAFKKFRDGYYELIDYGENWWRVFNQSTMFDEMMSEQWETFNKIDFMELIGKMSIAMAGTYVNFDAFADTVIVAAEHGYGFQPSKKDKENEH